MRIGVNLLAILPAVSGGIEFYVRNLLAALEQTDGENEYVLFTNLDNHGSFVPGTANFSRVRVPVRARPQLPRVLVEQLYLPILAKGLKLDLLHSPSYTWPVLASVPGVVTVCDMLYRVYPESIEWSKLIFWRLFVPWSAHRCRRILTISENSRRDIIRLLGVPIEKVVHTPLALDRRLDGVERPAGPEIEAACAKYGFSRPYVLQVGGVGLHKNALALVAALAILHRDPAFQDLSLVVTGNDYGTRQALLKETHRRELGAFVTFPGYVEHEDLPAIYSGASVYASPSYFEGFGLTLLEAMAYGTPVVTSDRSALPEVAANAALIIDPDNHEELAGAIKRILTDEELRARLICAGYERLGAYTWSETALTTLRAYQEAAEPVG